MSGLYGTVLLRKAFEVVDAGRVTDVLRGVADEVTETRKGRHWEFTVENGAGTLHVMPIGSTQDAYDDLLSQLQLTPNQTPEVVEIAFGCRRACDTVACKTLCSLLAKEFDGIDCGISY